MLRRGFYNADLRYSKKAGCYSVKSFVTSKTSLTENQKRLADLLKSEITDISILKNSGGPTELIVEELAKRLDIKGVKVSN